MEQPHITLWIDHKNKLISCIPLASGSLYRFATYEALYTYCQPLLEDRYRMQ